MRKRVTIALTISTLTVFGLAAMAQQHDRLFDLRKEMIDRIETAYTEGDSSTLERMVAVERRVDALSELEPDVLQRLRTLGVHSFEMCPERYHYVPTSNTCIPETSNSPASEATSPLLVSTSSAAVILPSDDRSIWLPGPGLGEPDISPPKLNIECTADDRAAVATATACTLEQVDICNTGTSAQCQAKIAECAALWANVSVDCSG